MTAPDLYRCEAVTVPTAQQTEVASLPIPPTQTIGITMQTHDVIQGSPEWLALRANFKTASEASAMMGASKYMTRDELLRQKATGHVPDVGAAKQALFDRGHETEAAARKILEEHIGEELYPITATRDGLLASFDGVTMDDSTGFEHKLWNASMVASLKAGELDPHYYWQLEQQIYVGCLEKVLFVVSDGTRENFLVHEYRAVPGRIEQLLAGWTQFDEDLANYQHTEVLPSVVAAVQPSLPAVVVQTNGAITVSSNLPAFAVALQAYIKTIPVKPSTDQEFADADAACTALKKAEGALDAAEENALASMSDVEQMRRVVADLKKLARDTRLATEKLVAARKESIRFEIRDEGIAAFAAHIAKLNEAIGRPYMPAIETDFPKAIKNKRTVESLRGAVNDELARAKIAAGDVAARIQINMKYLRENAADHIALFPDTATIVLKAADDLQSLVTSRIALHKAEEAKKEAAIVHRANCTARINLIKGFLTQAQAKTLSAEVLALIEQCNAVGMDGFMEHEAEATTAHARTIAGMQSIADALVKSEQRQADVAKAVAPIVEPVAAPVTAAEPVAQSKSRWSSGYQPVAAALTQAAAAPTAPAVSTPPSTPPSLRLGQIGERLGLGVTGDLLKTLGFEPAAVDKRAQLFHERDFVPICRALIQHIETAIEDATLAA
jgi:putative phage-type endonuclease